MSRRLPEFCKYFLSCFTVKTILQIDLLKNYRESLQKMVLFPKSKMFAELPKLLPDDDPFEFKVSPLIKRRKA
jgi:hypothetical protein